MMTKKKKKQNAGSALKRIRNAISNAGRAPSPEELQVLENQLLFQQQQDPMGNIAREPQEAGTFRSKPSWVQRESLWGPQTSQSANQIRPEIQQLLMSLMQQQQQPQSYSPQEFGNVMGDPEMSTGSMLQPLFQSLMQNEVAPRVPGWINWLSEYLNNSQQQPQTQPQQVQQQQPQSGFYPGAGPNPLGALQAQDQQGPQGQYGSNLYENMMNIRDNFR